MYTSESLGFMFDCCRAKRVFRVSKRHNFVTMQDTDMRVTSFSTAGNVF